MYSMVKLIFAMDKNRLIGKGNGLPWDKPYDLKHFKETTINKTVAMGWKTYESIGRPLPKRHNIVLSTEDYQDPYNGNIEVCKDLFGLLNKYKNIEEELFIVGGAEIYRLSFPYADEVIVSLIEGEFEGDTYIVEFEENFDLVNTVKKEGFKVLYYQKITRSRR